jgi:Glycosyltransferase 61
MFMTRKIRCLDAKGYSYSLILFLLLCSNSLFGLNTYQKILPLPFCYFENLYFDAQEAAFYGVGSDLEMDKAIAPNLRRPYTSKTGNKANVDEYLAGTTLFLLELEGIAWLNHYFHLLEHVVGIWAFYGDQNNHDVRLIVLGDGTSDWSWAGPNSINQHLLKALFPNAQVKAWHQFAHDYANKTLLFERAITSDRALTSNCMECAKLNKMLGVARHFISKESILNFALHVHQYAQTKHEESPNLLVTYLKRPWPRTLDKPLEDQLINTLSSLPGVSLRVVDFATISFFEQVNIIGNTDVLISVHSNGLSHILYLPEHAGVIEIFPPNSLLLDYRLFANARRLDYIGIISNQGIIWDDEAYALGCMGNANAMIYDLDFAPIIAFILNHSLTHRDRHIE